MSQQNRFKAILFAPYWGIIGPLLIALGMIISAVVYSGTTGEPYNPLNHFVSELGETDVAELAPSFNWGLILGGLLTLPFMITMANRLHSWLRWLLGGLGVLAAIFAILVGAIPMNYPAPNLVVALIFFYLGVVLMLLYTLVILVSKEEPYPKWLAIPGIFMILMGIWLIFSPPEIPTELDFDQRMGGLLQDRPELYVLAIVEWIAVLVILLWISLMGIYLTIDQARGKRESATKTNALS